MLEEDKAPMPFFYFCLLKIPVTSLVPFVITLRQGKDGFFLCRNVNIFLTQNPIYSFAFQSASALFQVLNIRLTSTVRKCRGKKKIKAELSMKINDN